MPCNEIGVKKSNGDVRILTVKICLKIALNAVRLPKFEPVNGKIVVAENDGGKRFTATLNADVILHCFG